MVMKRFLFIAACILLVTGVAGATASNIVLDRPGNLYRAVATENGIVVLVTSPDGNSRMETVPGTEAGAFGRVSLAVEPNGTALVVVWTDRSVPSGDRVEAAVFASDLWYGPYTLGGNDGGVAVHPSLFLDTIHETADDGATSVIPFVLVAWWQAPNLDALAEGHAELASFSLSENGEPLMDELAVEPLQTDTPWGVTCEASSHADSLTYPYLFKDPQSGDPHVMFVDFTDCLFSIRQITIEPENSEGGDDPDDDVTAQRRRHVVVFGRSEVIAIPTRVSFENASFEVGHDLSIVGYWDGEDGIEYVRMDENGWSETRTLPVDGGLTHEQAVDLIRRLAQQ